MEHFPSANWIELARGVLLAEQAVAMQDHLRLSCPECVQSAETWRRIIDSAAREAAYEPPAENVRVVNAAYVGERLKL